MWYLGVFLAAMGVDMIPVFAPPAWTIMVLLLVKFDLNPWLVLIGGVTGSTLGRYLFSLYVPKLSDKIIKKRKNDELKFVGEKLSGSRWKTWTFVFIYTLLPLSTTALFTAAGMGRVKPIQTLPPFFLGKFASDALMVATGKYLSSKSFKESMLDPKTLIAAVLGLILIGAVLFVDWRQLLEHKKLKFKFAIWK